MSDRRQAAPRAAALFDLDRTLVAGTSATAFGEGLAAAGVTRRRVPGAGALAASYQMIGETALTAAAARLAARATSGWSVDLVGQAAEAAADELMTRVQPYAPGVIDEHRAAGRLVVLATTSPEPLVRPFAERLGLDAVIATRWATDNGTYTGAIDGPLVWGRGKLQAVQAWADDERVDLRGSYAYSDSYYDAPLLAGVGTAVAVNPDARLAALARLRGWPIRHFDLPEGVPKFAGRELQEWARLLQRPELLSNVRLDVAGVEKIPREGAVIAVFNHRSYFDGAVVGPVLAQTGRSFRFLGKKEVFDAPVIGAFSRMAGGIRVNRSSGSDEPLEAAVKVLRAGEAIALAPEGTIPRGPAFFATELRGRWGAARLAAATGAPGRADRPVGHGEGVAAQLPAAHAHVRRAAGDPGARRGPGAAALPQHRQRHEEDHDGADGPVAARGPRRQDTRRPRSWPPPTRPATAAIPRSRPTAGRAPTPDPCRHERGRRWPRPRPSPPGRCERNASSAG